MRVLALVVLAGGCNLVFEARAAGSPTFDAAPGDGEPPSFTTWLR